jgi:hypothetical protein
MEVNGEASGEREFLQNLFQHYHRPCVPFCQNLSAICILEDRARECLIERVANAAIIRSLFEQALKDNRNNDEKVGGVGSPCRSPRWHVIHRPGTRFSMTAALPVLSTPLIQLRHLSSKPRAPRIASRLPHSIESKAFLKSSLRTAVGGH